MPLVGTLVQKHIILRLPVLIAQALAETEFPLGLGTSCPKLLHNTFVPLGFAQQSCCEAAFAEDSTGSLIGGQFNGRPVGHAGGPSSAVQCAESSLGAWHARC